MVKNQINSLKEAFNATGIAFDGQTAKVESATIDLRSDAREAERAEHNKLQKLDNNYARHHTPEENEGAGAPGRIANSHAQAKAQEIIQKQKKEKELSRFLTRLQEQRIELERQINRTIEYLKQKAEEAELQAGELRQKIIDNTELMIENSNFIRDVEKLLQADKDGITVDKDKLNKLVKDRGAAIDDSTPLPILLKTAEKMLVEANDENALLEVDNDIYDKNASKWEQKVEQYKTQATELQTKLDAVRAKGLSDEEYNQQVSEILEGIPREVKREYENRNGLNDIDNNAREENIAKEQEEVTVDPMADFITSEASKNKPNDNLDSLHTPSPAPSL